MGGERHREAGVMVRFEPVLRHRFVLEYLVDRVRCAHSIRAQPTRSSRWMRICIKKKGSGNPEPFLIHQ